MNVIYRNYQTENNTEDLTLEEAKQFECCKDLTDEQISELLETIRKFTETAYYVYAKNYPEGRNTIKQVSETNLYKLAS